MSRETREDERKNGGREGGHQDSSLPTYETVKMNTYNTDTTEGPGTINWYRFPDKWRTICVSYHTHLVTPWRFGTRFQKWNLFFCVHKEKGRSQGPLTKNVFFEGITRKIRKNRNPSEDATQEKQQHKGKTKKKGVNELQGSNQLTTTYVRTRKTTREGMFHRDLGPRTWRPRFFPPLSPWITL